MNITVFLADDHVMFRQGIRLLLENEKNITVVGEISMAVKQYGKS